MATTKANPNATDRLAQAPLHGAARRVTWHNKYGVWREMHGTCPINQCFSFFLYEKNIEQKVFVFFSGAPCLMTRG